MATATIELPQAVYDLTEETAQVRHIGLTDFFTKAAHNKTEPPWLATFGELSDLHEENKRIIQHMEKTFGQVEPEARR